MNKKNYLRPNMEVVEVFSQLMQMQSGSTSGGGDSAQTGSSGSSRSLNSFEDED